MRRDNIVPDNKGKKNYFNNLEFRKLIKLQEIDPNLAAIEYKKYIEKYPKDHYAQYMYVAFLITTKEFLEAEELLNKLDSIIQEEYEDNEYKRTLLESGISFNCHMKIYLYTRRYRKLYELMRDNYGKYNDKAVNATYLYAKKRMGVPLTKEECSYSYLSQQIYDYSEEELLNCIDKHFVSENVIDKNEAIFSSDIKKEELLREIRVNLDPQNKYCTGLLEDSYFFKLDYCGKNQDGTCNFLTVKCFADSNQIITIYPTKHGEYFEHVDLNYLRKNKNESKPKQLSRVDKFKQRYGL